MTTPQKWPNTLKAGCAAYLDTFSGLVPCRVTRITSTVDPLLARPRLEAHVEITKTVRAYRKGETDVMPTDRVVPKGAVQHRTYSSHILPYNIEVTP